MTRKTKQTIFMILTVILAIIVGGSLYLHFWLKKSVASTNGQIMLDGPAAEIEITFDKMGIPQIWAQNEHDGFFALGFLHASDRMFQMDMARRMSQGKISELLGKVTLEMDKTQRQIGHNRMAQKALSNLDDSVRNRLSAYADGVNAYKRNSGALPFEYLLLGATFEDWTVYDCLALLSFQTWYSDALQNHDRFYLNLVEKMGEEKAATLNFVYPDWAPVTIPESKNIGLLNSKSSKVFGGSIFESGITPHLMSNSSNAWVVGPDKSKSGKAILCSDPHLQINQLPQFWYMAGLHIKESNLNVLGITTPGLPFVIMGHNGTAAWAFTAGGIDITQFYSEKVNPNDSSQYQTPTGWKNFEFVTDTIFVSEQDSPLVVTTKFTHRGPVLIESDTENVSSLCWAGFDADIGLAAKSGFDLMSISDVETFRRTVTSMGALNANWLYADINGHIGYQLGTPIPKRQLSETSFSLPGWLDKFDWSGYHLIENTPHSINPTQNWLATSNNFPTRDIPTLTGSFAADRIMRITELMQSHDKLSVADCRRFQQDRTDSYLMRWRAEIAGQLLALGNQEMAERINNWNGSAALESKETAILMVYIAQLRKLTFQDELEDMYRGIRTIWLDHVFNNESTQFWFDDILTKKIETRDEISAKALSNALEIVGNKSWQDFNHLTMRHPMSEVPIIGNLLDLHRGTWPWPGTAGTLNASYIVSKNDSTFETIVGPSWRFVIDFADIDGASFVLPAGNSGNPMSPHFFDFNSMWQSGEYWNVPISYEKVKAKAAGTLLLTPQSGQ